MLVVEYRRERKDTQWIADADEQKKEGGEEGGAI